MRNDDPSTIYKDKFAIFVGEYVDGEKTLVSGHNTYSKGMNVVPDFGLVDGGSYGPDRAEVPRLYYNLNGEYSKLKGKIGFHDDHIDVDAVTVNIYTDENLAESIELHKGDLPKDVEIDVKDCKQLMIEFLYSSSNSAVHPGINLIEFILSY